MSAPITCPHCKNEIPSSAACCPHCGEPGLFWNIIQAESPAEQAALQNRYDSAKADALTRGSNLAVEDFQRAVKHSVAVIARSDLDLHRLANSTKQLYGTYYQQIDAGLRLPDGNDWDVAREVTDSLLFPNYKQEIRFAALSLDGIGLSNYGSCSVTLRDDMIAHRSSVFEENSVLFMEHHAVKASRTPNMPQGFRAVWTDRDKLCVAKLASRIDYTTTPNQYSGLLLKQGSAPENDEFVEVHIFGPISVLTIEKVLVTTPKTRQRATIVKALKSKLAKHGVSVK